MSSASSMFTFYRVSAKTFPFTEETRVAVGFYPYKKLASEIAKIISEHNMQRLKGGIDVEVDLFQGTRRDLQRVVYKEELDTTERDRLVGLRFKEWIKQPEKRSLEETQQEVATKLPRPSRAPEELITTSFNAELAGQNLTWGVEAAQTYAQDKYGDSTRTIRISFNGSGICAMACGPRTVDPIEVQNIGLTLEMNNEEVPPLLKTIGAVLPEKDHLFTLKTADEIGEEIKTLVDRAFEHDADLKNYGKR